MLHSRHPRSALPAQTTPSPRFHAMFSSVLGLFSQDLAVDPGTSCTRVWQRGRGLVAEEPTLVAVHTCPKGRRAVTAIGESVAPMIGRTPGDLEVVEPIRDGRIHDYGVAEAFLLHLFRQIHGRNTWMRPRVVVPMPGSASPMETRAVRDSCESAGAREVLMVPRALAAALGADLNISESHGQLVIDLGAGSIEVALIALDQVVAVRSIAGGGSAMDLAIVEYLRRNHDLLVATGAARQLKHELGAACEAEARIGRVAGRCLRKGTPRSVEIRADEVCRAIGPCVDAIHEAVASLLREAPDQLAADVARRGMVLTGGGASLRDLDRVLWRRTGLPVLVARSATQAVIRGAGQVLETVALQRAVAC